MQPSPYREKAIECAAAAERARDPKARLELFKIARAFLLLDFRKGVLREPLGYDKLQQ
jgi:hypothetical protein